MNVRLRMYKYCYSNIGTNLNPRLSLRARRLSLGLRLDTVQHNNSIKICNQAGEDARDLSTVESHYFELSGEMENS